MQNVKFKNRVQESLGLRLSFAKLLFNINDCKLDLCLTNISDLILLQYIVWKRSNII